LTFNKQKQTKHNTHKTGTKAHNTVYSPESTMDITDRMTDI